MFQRVNTLLESEGNELMEKHEDLVVEAMTLVNDFRKTLKAFALNNPTEFLGENTEETYKNLRVYSEVGTSQFISEISNLFGSMLHEKENVVTETETKLEDYI